MGWTTGCQFRCLYCHNPDTWTLSNGIPVTLARAAKELQKYRHGLKIMSGGFTLSGGEPLMQDRFAIKLLTAAKSMGIHTALDTNGTLGSRLPMQSWSRSIWCCWISRRWDPERHRHLTGMDNGPVLDFARRLARSKRSIWVRFVLVPGLTDNVDDVSHTASFSASLGNVERVDVLPFHPDVADSSGRVELKYKYTLDDIQPPDLETIERVCMQFRSEGLKVF